MAWWLGTRSKSSIASKAIPAPTWRRLETFFVAAVAGTRHLSSASPHSGECGYGYHREARRLPMELAQTKLVLWHKGKGAQVDGTRIRFSAHQCFARDGGADDLRCLGILVDHLAAQPGLAVCIDGGGAFLGYVLKHF